MRVINLQVDNFKKLKAIDITPDGNIVELAGKNRQGKSTVLDAIAAAMCGSPDSKEYIIRDGEKQSRIRLDLGELVVTRKFTKKGDGPEWTTSLTVENAQGAKYPSPQAMLDALYGHLAFDPLAFTRMDRKAQVEALKRLVTGVNFDQIETQNKLDYDRRTEFNRDAKNLRAQVAGLDIDITKPRPVKVEVTEVQAELAKAQAHNEDVTKRQANREQAPHDIATNRERANELTNRSEKLRIESEKLHEEAVVFLKEADDLERRLKAAAPLPALIDAAALVSKMEQANTTNNLVLAWAKMDLLVGQAEALEKHAVILTDAIDTRNAEKAQAIKDAKLPVEGLGLSDQGVTLNGLPFDQAASSEQIRTSVGVAMALNPKLRVIRVKDGSLLDAESMTLLTEMAADKDYQVWVERVADASATGFILEDGTIKTTQPS